jgi:hypothetical protein
LARRSSRGNNMAKPSSAKARTVNATSVSSSEKPAARSGGRAVEGASAVELGCLVRQEWIEWSRFRP